MKITTFAITAIMVGIILIASSFVLSLSNPDNDKEDKQKNKQQNASDGQPTTFNTELKQAKIVFAQFNGTKIQFYTMNSDGSNIKELSTGDAEERMTTNDPDNHLEAKISPGGTMIAYKVAPQKNYTAQAPADLTIINVNGENKKIIAQKVEKFFWSPDSKNILYSANTPPITLQTDAKEVIEAPMLGPGSEWYLYNIKTDERKKLQFKNTFYTDATGFLNADNILFIATSAYGGVAPQAYIYNIQTKTERQIKLNEEQVAEAISVPKEENALISLVPIDYGIKYQCKIDKIKKNGEKIKTVIYTPDHVCNSLYWINEAEFIFEKATGPNGKIDIRETGEAGYYIVPSIYAYNLKTEKENILIKSKGKEIYKLLDIVPEIGILISNQNIARNPQYIYEWRKKDGTQPMSIMKSNTPIIYIGTTPAL